jgi:hypothetical protein
MNQRPHLDSLQSSLKVNAQWGGYDRPDVNSYLANKLDIGTIFDTELLAGFHFNPVCLLPKAFRLKFQN